MYYPPTVDLNALKTNLNNLLKEPSVRLLKHVVRCYLRLSDNPRAKEALKSCLPDQLKDSTFLDCLKEDASTKKWLAQLIKNLEPFAQINQSNMAPGNSNNNMQQIPSSISPSAAMNSQYDSYNLAK